MFMGLFKHSIDLNGRVIIPSKMRDELGKDFIITRGYDRCIYIYNRETYEKKLEQFDDLPDTVLENRKFEREMFLYMNEANMDKNGRVMLPEMLRDMMDIKGDVYIIGVRKRIEIWDTEVYKNYKATVAPLEELANNIKRE